MQLKRHLFGLHIKADGVNIVILAFAISNYRHFCTCGNNLAAGVIHIEHGSFAFLGAACQMFKQKAFGITVIFKSFMKIQMVLRDIG